MPVPLKPQRRSLVPYFTVALLIAGAWRLIMAALMPVMSRDGVEFCWFAQRLGEQGFAFLQSPEAVQHPLLPTLLLIVHYPARIFVAPDLPLGWQVAGQVVTFTAGMAVVALTGLITQRLLRLLDLPVQAHTAVLFAMLLAGLLDHNVWLSVDVMSDQVHLALYLAGIWLLLRLRQTSTGFYVGLLAGLAFLTRQEGFVLVAGGLSALFAQRRRFGYTGVATRSGVLVAGFLLCALPYWAAVGEISTKKDFSDLLGGETAAAAPPTAMPAVAQPDADLVYARLETHDLPWWQVLPHALYKLLRSGRVVIPLLALVPLINLRGRLLQPTLVGPLTCGLAHFALTLVLLSRFGYLAPRHLLVPTLLLTPLAGMMLARIWQLLYQNRLPYLAAAAAAALLLPVVLYAARVPNRQDAHLRVAIEWLKTAQEDLKQVPLLGAATSKRLAFYTNMRWVRMPEAPAGVEQVAKRIRTIDEGFLALELPGPGGPPEQFERVGNRALLERLQALPEIGPRLQPVKSIPGPGGSTLELLRILPAAAG